MSSVEGPLYSPQYNEKFSMRLSSFMIGSMAILRAPDCLHNKAITPAIACTMSIFTQKLRWQT